MTSPLYHMHDRIGSMGIVLLLFLLFIGLVLWAGVVPSVLVMIMILYFYLDATRKTNKKERKKILLDGTIHKSR